MKKGWLCPRCGTIWSPYSDRCEKCSDPEGEPEPNESKAETVEESIEPTEDEHGLL